MLQLPEKNSLELVYFYFGLFSLKLHSTGGLWYGIYLLWNCEDICFFFTSNTTVAFFLKTSKATTSFFGKRKLFTKSILNLSIEFLISIRVYQSHSREIHALYYYSLVNSQTDPWIFFTCSYFSKKYRATVELILFLKQI